MNLRRLYVFSLLCLVVLGLLSGCAPLATATPGSTAAASPQERTARLPHDITTSAATAEASVAQLAQPSAEPVGPAQFATAPGEFPQVTILLTNDVHGKVDPCG
jgi:2',3'-cyclic-nucleotide 2'-phosphodiesterase (5'-nucleotidase family)